jgi:DNA-binding NarL/FixJ family response regulator
VVIQPVPKRTVLLVDDNAIVRSMLRQLFETEEDFIVAGEAENGQEAIEKADNLRPDLVILDLTMPVMNGLDAASHLSKHLPHTRLILFTVEQGKELVRVTCQVGIHAVVAKENAYQLVPQARWLLAQVEGDGDAGQLKNAS